jgi:intracellular sulfur oxidation DsrE/DsrF family protein
MPHKESTRRSFVTGIGAGVAALGVGASAEAQTAPAAFRPTRHADDDWLDAIPGQHRMIVDAATPKGAGEAILYANNLYTSNKSAYGLAESELAIVVCLRHYATPFAFTDAMWAKYGRALGPMLEFVDPKSKESPTTNLYNATGYGLQLSNLGTTIDSVIKKGVRIAICDQATRFTASGLARAMNTTVDAIYNDFKANPVPSSRFVPAGVLAVNRAQERGYTLIYAG